MMQPLSSPDDAPSPQAAPAPAAAARPAPKPLFFGLGLCLLTLIVYLPVLHSDFTNFDDGLYVTNNPHVQAGFTWKSFLWAWQTNVASNWHPVTMLSHMLDCQLYALNPKGHHLTNLVLHLAAVWLLFEVLRRMTGAPWRSAAVAALFGIHPLHVESVAWVAERKDVLSGLFFMLSLGAYLRYTRRRTAGRYALLILLLSLGLLAKSMLVTVPCVLLLLDVWPLGRLPVTSWQEAWPALRKLAIEKLPLFIPVVAISAITVYTQQQSLAKLDAVSVGRRTGNVLTSYAIYLGKLFWPKNMAVFYPLPVSVPVGKTLAAGALLAVITAFVLLRLRRSPWLGVGWLWFLGMLVPVIGILQVGRQGMADRYTYLPSIGLFLAVVWEVSELASRRRSMRAFQALRAVLATATAVVLAALAIDCRRQVETWKDSKTLFGHAIAVTDRNYLAHLNYGVALAHEGNDKEAKAEYYKALAIQPNMMEAQAALGTALYNEGRYWQALPHLRRAIRLQGDNAHLYHTLAMNLDDMERYDDAIAALRKALEIIPRYADAEYGLGSIYLEQGKTADALEHYQKALEINPDLDDLYQPTAKLLADRGDLAGAVRLYTEAVRHQPDSAAACYDLAVTLERLGKVQEARGYYTRALQLNPRLTAARQRLLATGGLPFAPLAPPPSPPAAQ
jgi:protein O-mannosyl-transferase